jgi:site-specific DNA-methyltransferase (adenine-specific)
MSDIEAAITLVAQSAEHDNARGRYAAGVPHIRSARAAGACAPPAPRLGLFLKDNYHMKRRASLAATDPGLFENSRDPQITADELDQHDTPYWACEMIVDKKFSHLKTGDRVYEPFAGSGNFLRALKPGIIGMGVEIDPVRAAMAQRLSGHPVIVGDIRRVEIPDRLNAVITNPPFDLKIVSSLLKRLRNKMVTGGKVGMLLPAYAFQTEANLLEWNKSWSIHSENVPRRLFEGLISPLVYAEFTAEERRVLIGFFLYSEMASIRAIPNRYAEEMAKPTGGIWFGVLFMALEEMGGESSMKGIYDAVEGRQPTPNPFWREQLRKVKNKAVAAGKLFQTSDNKIRTTPMAA